MTLFCAPASVLVLTIALVVPWTSHAQDVNTKSIPVVDHNKNDEQLPALYVTLIRAITALKQSHEDLEVTEQQKEELEEQKARLEQDIEATKAKSGLNAVKLLNAQNGFQQSPEIARMERELTDVLGQINELRTTVEAQKELTAKLNAAAEALDELKNNRAHLRIYLGFGVHSFRSPRYELVPSSPEAPDVFAIRNTTTGQWDLNGTIHLAYMAFDFRKDHRQTIAVGPQLGLGVKSSLFQDIYCGGFLRLWGLYLHGGFNFRRYNALQAGFGEGDTLSAGRAIPTTEQWKVFTPYFGAGADFDALASQRPRRA